MSKSSIFGKANSFIPSQEWIRRAFMDVWILLPFLQSRRSICCWPSPRFLHAKESRYQSYKRKETAIIHCNLWLDCQYCDSLSTCLWSAQLLWGWPELCSWSRQTMLSYSRCSYLRCICQIGMGSCCRLGHFCLSHWIWRCVSVNEKYTNSYLESNL